MLSSATCTGFASLQEMDDTLAKTESKAEAYEQKHSEAVQSVNVLRNAVWEMFNRIG